MSEITSTNTMLILTPCQSNCSSPESADDLGSSKENNLYYRWVKVSIALLITALILASNAINIVALYRMREIGLRMKVLLMSLSTSDLCLGLFVCMPAVVSGILSRWPFGPVMCQITGIMNGVAISVSLWSLMGIGLERFLVMRKPGVSRSKKNSHIVGGCVAFIWIFNTLFFALPIAWEPDYLYYSYDPDVLTCSFMWKHTWHFLTAKFLYPIMSGTIIVFTSWKVNQVLKRAERARKQWIINPISRVGVPTNDPKDPMSMPKSDSKQEDKKSIETSKPMSAGDRHRMTPHLDQTRLTASWSPLLMRDFELRNSPPLLVEAPFACPSSYRNRQARLSLQEAGQLEAAMAESSSDNNYDNIKSSKNGFCFPVSSQEMTSPLSHSDLTVHLQNSQNNQKARAVGDNPPEPVPNRNFDKMCDTGKPGIGQNSQIMESSASLCPNDDACTKHKNDKTSSTLCPFKFNNIKTTRKKEVTFQGSMSLKNDSIKADRRVLKPFEAPMSKSFLRRQNKAKALLLCTTTVFFIAISPYSISSLLEHFIPNLSLPSWLRFLALWTLCTNCLLNVFIYSAVYTEFRSHCKHILQPVTCRDKKIIDHISSGPTSSVFELFAAKGKAKNVPGASKTENSNNGSSRNAVCHVSSHSNISFNPSGIDVPDIRAVSASPFEGLIPQSSTNNPHHLQPPARSTQATRRKGSEGPNIIQILPASPPQHKLQPRDDAGPLLSFNFTSPRLVSGSSTNSATPSSIGISPPISQSTRSSCSLDYFTVEMMPSVDV